VRDLHHMTAELVRTHTEFPTLEDYLNGYAITGRAPRAAEVPAIILISLDDPIIPSAASRASRDPQPCRSPSHATAVTAEFFQQLLVRRGSSGASWPSWGGGHE